MEKNDELASYTLQELRAKLDQIVSKENEDNWWKPELFELNTQPLLPAELEIVAGVPNEEENYNCFVYVLGLQQHPDIIGNQGWDFTRMLGLVFDELIEKELLQKVAVPRKDSVIVYRAKNGSISHVGLLEDEQTVVSKWSWGPLLRHRIFAVPADYGNVVEFYALTPAAIDYVLAKRALA